MITLNAFQAGFRNDLCSVQGAIPRSVRWVFDLSPFAGVTIFEDAAMWAQGADKVNSTYRVGWLHEPHQLHPHYFDKAIALRHRFDCILTHYQPLIDAYPESFRFAVHGGVSVSPTAWGLWPKWKNVAMMSSGKRMTDNHQLRFKIATEMNGIDVYRNLYGEAKTDTLRDYRFLVIVENSSEANWWTEHFWDAIALGCVPLYYYPEEAQGAPHAIGRYAPNAFEPFEAWDELRSLVARDYKELNANYEFHRPYIARAQSQLSSFICPEDWYVTHALSDMLEDREAVFA